MMLICILCVRVERVALHVVVVFACYALRMRVAFAASLVACSFLLLCVICIRVARGICVVVCSFVFLCVVTSFMYVHSA